MILAILFLVAAVLLLIHHGIKHHFEDSATSLAQKESCAAVCYFQLSDIRNHEAWILVFASISITLFILESQG